MMSKCVTQLPLAILDTCYNTSITVTAQKLRGETSETFRSLLPSYSESNLNKMCIYNYKDDENLLICSVRWQISFGFYKLGMCWVMSPAVNSAAPSTI